MPGVKALHLVKSQSTPLAGRPRGMVPARAEEQPRDRKRGITRFVARKGRVWRECHFKDYKDLNGKTK